MEREAFLARFPLTEAAEEPPPVAAWEGGADPDAFLRAVRRAGGEARAAGPGDWPEAVASLAREWGVATAVDTAQEELGPAMEALRRVGVEPAAPDVADLGLTGARWGLASTGTVVLVAGPDHPRSVSLLPAAHLAVVREEDLLPDLAALARAMGEEVTPSAVTLVTGPSRTADIEQTLVVGAHGPARTGVVLVRTR